VEVQSSPQDLPLSDELGHDLPRLDKKVRHLMPLGYLVAASLH